jgi:transposase
LRASEQQRPDVAAEREVYAEAMAQLDPTRCVFLDESGILTNMTRRYARAPIGQRAFGAAPAHWKRLTVLGALSCDGVVATHTVDGGTTVPAFVEFLQTALLPVLGQRKPNAVLIMDNLSTHKSKAAREAIENAGFTVKYLPRYSPDFSPIEPCWSKIKTALRTAAARTVETLKAALEGAAASVTAEDARGWFTHCGHSLVN